MLPALRSQNTPTRVRKADRIPVHGTFSSFHAAQRRTPTYLLIGVVLGAICLAVLVGTLIVSIVDGGRATVAEQPLPNKGVFPVTNVDYLYVPKRKILAGEQIANSDFEQVHWPKNSIPPGAIVSLSLLTGRYARHPLAKGAPVLHTSVSRQPKVNRLGIGEGLRAMTIPVNEVSGVEGHLEPGANVDIIWTYVDREGILQTTMLIENKRVLSYGGSLERLKKGELNRAPKIFHTVTLELGAEEAMGALAAQGLGKLTLMMRSPDDSGVIGRQTVTINDVNETGRTRGEGRRRFPIRYCPSTPGSRVPLGTPRYPPEITDPLDMPPGADLGSRGPVSTLSHSCYAPTFF